MQLLPTTAANAAVDIPDISTANNNVHAARVCTLECLTLLGRAVLPAQAG